MKDDSPRAGAKRPATAAMLVVVGIAVLACGIVALAGGFDGTASSSPTPVAAGTTLRSPVPVPAPAPVPAPRVPGGVLWTDSTNTYFQCLKCHDECSGVQPNVKACLDFCASSDENPVLEDNTEGDVYTARRSSAEHLIATKAPCCTATAWILTVAQCSAIP